MSTNFIRMFQNFPKIWSQWNCFKARWQQSEIVSKPFVQNKTNSEPQKSRFLNTLKASVHYRPHKKKPFYSAPYVKEFLSIYKQEKEVQKILFLLKGSGLNGRQKLVIFDTLLRGGKAHRELAKALLHTVEESQGEQKRLVETLLLECRNLTQKQKEERTNHDIFPSLANVILNELPLEEQVTALEGFISQGWTDYAKSLFAHISDDGQKRILEHAAREEILNLLFPLFSKNISDKPQLLGEYLISNHLPTKSLIVKRLAKEVLPTLTPLGKEYFLNLSLESPLSLDTIGKDFVKACFENLSSKERLDSLSKMKGSLNCFYSKRFFLISLLTEEEGEQLKKNLSPERDHS